jgi:GntR family transcriptional regulator
MDGQRQVECSRRWIPLIDEVNVELRYAELAQMLVRDITQGTVPVGTILPSEVELARQYNVSRTTVRSALSVVEGLGLISRRRRAGTRVEATHPPRTYARSLTAIEDLVQYAAETERHVQSIRPVVCDDKLAATLECHPGQRWLQIQMLRIAPAVPDLPVCWTDIYLEPAIGKAVRNQVHQSTGLVCDIIARTCGRFVASVEQTIRAVKVNPSLAKALNVDADSPALAITRRYIDPAGTAFQITVSTHPADRFDYRLSLNHTLPQRTDQ